MNDPQPGVSSYTPSKPDEFQRLRGCIFALMLEESHPDKPQSEVSHTCGKFCWLEHVDWGKKKCCKKYKKGKRCKDCPRKK